MENMGLFVSSDCSNGSTESGWTVYLQHSLPSANSFDVNCKANGSREEEDKLDLSMVSDATSGPQTFRENEVSFPENDNECFYPSSETARLAKNNRKKKESKGKGRHEDEEQFSSTFLDDTASSPVFNFNTERSNCQNQSNNLRQSASLNQKQKNQWFKGKRFSLK